MFKKLINRLLDFVAYIVLGILGLSIFQILYLAWFTEMGKALISMSAIIIALIWAIIRVLRKK